MRMTYKIKKENARQKAIEYKCMCFCNAYDCIPYKLLTFNYWYTLGKKYGLIKEFKSMNLI